jgi:hypothetical protein
VNHWRIAKTLLRVEASLLAGATSSPGDDLTNQVCGLPTRVTIKLKLHSALGKSGTEMTHAP